MDLKLLSWNLDGLDERFLDERTEAACLRILLQPAPADLVLLQEVVPRSLLAHLRPHFAAAGFAVVPAEPPPERNYFVTLMVRGTLKPTKAWTRSFPGSQMGRALLGVELDVGGPLLVLTSHFESLREGKAERMRQLASVAAELTGFAGPAVFAGDTNLRDEEVAAVPEAEPLIDAWERVGSPKALRATWFRREGRPPGARFDRVYLNRWPGWDVTGFRRLGEAPVDEAGGMRVSDHLAVEVDLALRRTEGGAG